MSAASQFFGCGGIGDPVPNTMKVIEVLLIGGGGGGGGGAVGSPGYIASGGGAGAMVEGKSILVNTGETFSIVIGAGGAGNPQYYNGSKGSESTFGNIPAGGGGGGAGLYPTTATTYGTTGGSGGGGGSSSSPSGFSSIIGGIVGTSSLNLRADVFNVHSQITTFASPGTTACTNGPTPSATPGGGAGGDGAGRSNSITGSPVTYAAGGAGNAGPTAATANTGNGGGGGQNGPTTTTGGTGGSGVCIVRWPTAYPAAASVSGNTPTPAQPGYYVYRWNGDGSITF